MYTNTTFSFIDDYGRHGVTYFAEKDGKVHVSEDIVDTWNKGYSFDTDGQGYTGMKTIQNITYYFSKGELRKNQAFSLDGINYYKSF